jgi:hypothetical protein
MRAFELLMRALDAIPLTEDPISDLYTAPCSASDPSP